MKKVFLFTILFLSFLRVQAQKDFRPGYIVTLQGDTLKGLVNYKGALKSSLQCEFKVSENAEPETYLPDRLLGYGFAGSRFYESNRIRILSPEVNPNTNTFEYAPVTGNTDQNFMEVLVKGTATLYYLLDANSKPHYYIRKQGNEIKELVYLEGFLTSKEQNKVKPEYGKRFLYQSKLYAGVLTLEFQDCPAVKEKINNTPLETTALIKLVTAYNNCVLPEKEQVVAKKPKPRPSLGITAGVNFSKLSMAAAYNYYLNESSFGFAPTFTAGIFLDLPLPALNEKLTLQNTLFYSQKNNSGQFEHSIEKQTNYKYHATFNLTYVRLASVLRYTVPKGKIRPFVNAGISNGLLVKFFEEVNEEKYFLQHPPTYKTREAEFPAPRKYEFGMIGGLGAELNISGKKRLMVESRYEFANGFSPYTGIRARNKNISLLTSICF